MCVFVISVSECERDTGYESEIRRFSINAQFIIDREHSISGYISIP